MASHWDQRFETENSDGVLIILGELSEDGQKLLDNMIFVKLGRDLSELRGAGSSDHRGIFLAKFHELLSESLLLCVGARVGVEEKVARGHTACKPLSLSKSDDKWAEHVLHLGIREGL